jgi:hypothetical protein
MIMHKSRQRCNQKYLFFPQILTAKERARNMALTRRLANCFCAAARTQYCATK